jgi:ATP/maltotriose-dependent transcriptional regulator MalT
MNDEKARHMLELSRLLHWDFPSSQGTPIINGHAKSQQVEQAAKDRESYANAARVLLERGDEEGAIEIASNTWRLWVVVARDTDGGRTFLATVLDKSKMKPSRARSPALYGDALLACRQGKIEDPGMVRAELQNLGLVEIHRGNVDSAERYFAESERLGQANGPYSNAMAHLYRSAMEFVRGNMGESSIQLQHAQSVLKVAGMEAGRDDQFEFDWLLTQLTKRGRK